MKMIQKMASKMPSYSMSRASLKDMSSTTDYGGWTSYSGEGSLGGMSSYSGKNENNVSVTRNVMSSCARGNE